MTRVLHLVVGPAQHGVVRHAVGVARACGDTLLRSAGPQGCRVPTGYDVIHIPYTDRLFGSTAEASAAAFSSVAEAVLASGARLSTTLHDVPTGDDHLARRRRLAYSEVVSHASGLVVGSNAELAHAELLGDRARSRCVIPLPVAKPLRKDCTPAGSTVGVLGFIYPDRGYDQVIAALPEHVRIVALGRAADGHDDLPDLLRRRALRAGRTWQMTGFLSDEALSRQLRSVAVPVAPSRRTAASASIATWLAHGRRPLVPVSAYTRELDRSWPDTLIMYDPDSPHALRAAIQSAHANPASTLLEAGVQPGPSEADVTSAHRVHFRACAEPTVISAAAGRFTVSDNRWDLLEGCQPAHPPTVSVVIPYYDAPGQLGLVLHALTLQNHPSTRMEVIVADDGSSLRPCTQNAAGLTIAVVRQEDHGFRAAAARNLGAAAAGGEVLLFLDADTVPEPEYVSRMARLPSLTTDALVVGRRRHADFTDWTPADVSNWLQNQGARPPELHEPGWLREGYRTSGNLLEVDARSYRYVISAVLGMNRELFHAIGGFCEQFTSYGGEDWELAHRAYCAGALIAHVAAAVAWHDGPDWAGRPVDHARIKAAETRMLQRLLPDSATRGPGQWLPYPAVVIRMVATECGQVRDSANSAFASGADCAIWLTGPHAYRTSAELKDDRVKHSPPPPEVMRRALFVIDLAEPVNLSGLPHLLEIAATAGDIRTPHGRFRATRALERARRHVAAFNGDRDAALHVLFGRRDMSAVRPMPHRAD